MLMDVGLDTGPLLAKARAAILPADTAGSLGWRLAALGADLLIDTLPRWARREMTAVPQDESLATYAPQLRKEDGLLDWRRPAEELWRRCRAFSPWPGAFTHWRGLLLKVIEAAPLLDLEPTREPGSVRVVAAEEARARALYPELLPERGRVLVAATGAGALALLRVQLQGGRPVTGEELARGHRDLPGARLGA
jgi:methionyl-tRNA formyltransferase